MADIIDETLPLDTDLAGYGAKGIRDTRVALNDAWADYLDAHTVVKSASYAVLDTDKIKRILVDTTLGDVTITLPLKANNIDRYLEITHVKQGGTYKVIIVPHATDVTASHMLTNDNLSAMWLPEVGDWIKFQESQYTNVWESVGERITAELKINGYAGMGSTDTMIMRWTTLETYVGNIFTHNHTSGYSGNSKGLEITLLRDGWYSGVIGLQAVNGSGVPPMAGFSKNSSHLTTDMITMQVSYPSEVFLFATGSINGGGGGGGAKWFPKNTVLRTHAGTSYIASGSFVSISYLGQ